MSTFWRSTCIYPFWNFTHENMGYFRVQKRYTFLNSVNKKCLVYGRKHILEFHAQKVHILKFHARKSPHFGISRTKMYSPHAFWNLTKRAPQKQVVSTKTLLHLKAL